MIDLDTKEAREAAQAQTETKQAPSWGSVHLNQKNKRRQSDTPPAAKIIKRAWHAHKKENARSKVSLKAFARTLSGDAKKDVVEWFANKQGVLDRMAKKKKVEMRGGTIRAIAMATKSSRRGSKSGG